MLEVWFVSLIMLIGVALFAPPVATSICFLIYFASMAVFCIRNLRSGGYEGFNIWLGIGGAIGGVVGTIYSFKTLADQVLWVKIILLVGLAFASIIFLVILVVKLVDWLHAYFKKPNPPVN